MKLGMMQPYFFPYAGYISLIKHTDLFILCDTVQFMRQGWIERNRVLKQGEGWLYLKIPLLKKSGALIKDVRIKTEEEWRQKIMAQLEHYKKFAPYYLEVKEMLAELFEKDFTDIVALNKEALSSVCRYLNIATKIRVFSKMNLEIDPPAAPDEWALNTCKKIKGVDEYWNPPGGKKFYDKNKYERANISLKFQNINLAPYPQKRAVFEPKLSIIDVMMFNSPEKINKMLDDYELI